MTRNKKVTLYCTEDCDIYTDGRIKEFHFGDKHDFSEVEAEKILKAGRRKFADKSTFTTIKRDLEAIATKEYESDEAKKPRSAKPKKKAESKGKPNEDAKEVTV